MVQVINPFSDGLNAMHFVGLFLDKPEQVKAFFGSLDEFYETLAGSASYLRDGTTGNGRSNTNSLWAKVQQWEQDANSKIDRVRDITIGVATANVVGGALCWIPVAGAFLAISTGIASLATMSQTTD